MIVKRLLVIFLAVLMCFTLVTGCENNCQSDAPPEDTIKFIELDADNLPILKGDSYNINLTTYENNVVLSGVTYEFESEDTSIATVSGNVLSGVSLGETVINVTVKLDGSVIATKKLQCVVNNNNAIYTNKVSYELYTMDNVLGTSYKTEDVVLTSIFIDGEMLTKFGNIIWVSEDETIATIDGSGKITAVAEGETYVTGCYRYGDVEIETRKIPVKVSKPYLSTNIDVLFDKTNESGLGQFSAKQVLGAGYKIGKVVDLDTKREYIAENNAISLNSFPVGDYRLAVYEENEEFATEINVVVADYIINSVEDLNADWFDYSYVALNADLTDVGLYYKPNLENGDEPSFDNATFNGMGHKISGIVYRFNGQSLFRTVTNSTIKNLALQCTVKLKNQGGLFAKGLNVIVDNVYIETTFTENANISGGLCDVAWNPLSVTNTVIKTYGCTDSGICGAMMARGSVVRLTLDNTYVISPLKICSTVSNASNTKFGTINENSKNVLFDSENELASAESTGTVAFDGFNQYWDLSGELPIFKSMK